MEKDLPTEKAVLGLCLKLADNALQLVSRKVGQETENVIQLICDASFDSGGLRRQVEADDYCKRLLINSNDEAGLRKILRRVLGKLEAAFQFQGTVLYRKNVFTAAVRGMTTGWSQKVFPSSWNVSNHLRNSVGALHEQDV